MTEVMELGLGLRVWIGNALDVLAGLPAASVQAAATSSPYYGLRDYAVPATDWPAVEYRPMPGLAPITVPAWHGCLGQEPTPEMFTAHLVLIARQVWRVLRPDGVFWLNLGDCYSRSGGSTDSGSGISNSPKRRTVAEQAGRPPEGLRQKNLMQIPSRVAFALQAEGWILRSKPPWLKDNAMPESVTDRPAVAHEELLMLVRSDRPLFWTHQDGRGTRRPPAPDYRWVDRANGGSRVQAEPPNWRTERLPGKSRRRWSRINLWTGHDFYYDAESIRLPVAAGTLRRARQDVANQLGSTRANGGSRTERPMSMVGDLSGRSRRTTDWWTAALEDAAAAHLRQAAALLTLVEAGGAQVGAAGDVQALKISTQAYKEGHFAVWPVKLVEPLILSSSAPLACGNCGAPWWHQVVTRPRPIEGHVREGTGRRDVGGRLPGAPGLPAQWDDRLSPVQRVDVGWHPTCDCPENAGTGRCVVLDKFAGSGTTLRVAVALGREGWGIELNREYATRLIPARAAGGQQRRLGV